MSESSLIENLLRQASPNLPQALRDQLLFQAGVAAGRRGAGAGWITMACFFAFTTIGLAAGHWWRSTPARHLADEQPTHDAPVQSMGADSARQIDARSKTDAGMMAKHQPAEGSRILRVADRENIAWLAGREMINNRQRAEKSPEPSPQPDRPVLTPIRFAPDLNSI